MQSADTIEAAYYRPETDTFQTEWPQKELDNGSKLGPEKGEGPSRGRPGASGLGNRV